MSKYFHDCDREGFQFFPVVVEALGGWHEDAAVFITRLARQLASRTGKEADEQIKHLFQRLGILLMRGNSAIILKRTPIPNSNILFEQCTLCPLTSNSCTVLHITKSTI
jgi:hypothetical protein